MYENAGLADSLCFVNQWDHCTIPIHALEVALKLRQLDTVAFFLKNQDKGKITLSMYKGFYKLSNWFHGCNKLFHSVKEDK